MWARTELSVAQRRKKRFSRIVQGRYRILVGWEIDKCKKARSSIDLRLRMDLQTSQLAMPTNARIDDEMYLVSFAGSQAICS